MALPVISCPPVLGLPGCMSAGQPRGVLTGPVQNLMPQSSEISWSWLGPGGDAGEASQGWRPGFRLERNTRSSRPAGTPPFAEGTAVRRRATSRLSKHFDHIQESTGHRPVELDGHVIAAGHSVDLVVRSNLAVFYMKLARALKP